MLALLLAAASAVSQEPSLLEAEAEAGAGARPYKALVALGALLYASRADGLVVGGLPGTASGLSRPAAAISAWGAEPVPAQAWLPLSGSEGGLPRPRAAEPRMEAQTQRRFRVRRMFRDLVQRAASDAPGAPLAPAELLGLGPGLLHLVEHDAAKAARYDEGVLRRLREERESPVARGVAEWAGKQAADLLTSHGYYELRHDPEFGPFIGQAEDVIADVVSSKHFPHNVPKPMIKLALWAGDNVLPVVPFPGKRRFMEATVANALELMAAVYATDLATLAQGAADDLEQRARAAAVDFEHGAEAVGQNVIGLEQQAEHALAKVFLEEHGTE